MIDVPELIMAWGRGWTVSRGVHPPVDVPGGWMAEVGLPDHCERHVLHTWDAGRLAGIDPRPGMWIKAVGGRDDLRAALPEPWTLDEDTFLMTTRLGGGTAVAPDGYRVEVGDSGAVVTATAFDSAGEVAAVAHLAGAGDGCAVVDRVTTQPGHRRRGLGTTVMTALADHAVRAGLTTGLLVASDDGRYLYETLGWTTRGRIAAAYVPVS